MHLLMWGVILCCLASGMYLLGVLVGIPRILTGNSTLLGINEWLVWYSGIPLVTGLLLALIDLFLLLGDKRQSAIEVRFDQPSSTKAVVVLTAYNDELSIAAAVEDFRAHPMVSDVIVVSNNSSDRTLLNAEEAGAIAVDEPRQGYGRCVYRCLTEGIARGTELIVLCEGDCTFRAYDIDKLLAYVPHADIVNGTRTVERLRARDTQLSTFMYYGNLFVGKVLEAKHVGRCTIRTSDPGRSFGRTDTATVKTVG